MRDPAVEVGRRELEAIGEYVQSNLGGWLQSIPAFQYAIGGREVLDRLIKMEGQLEHQRELMEARFDAVDKRFEATDKRFETMDKRFDDLVHLFDKRFESMDKRFDDLIHFIDKRFEASDKRFNLLQWMIGGGFAVMTVLLTLYQVL